MPRATKKMIAAVGAAEHGNSAVLVTVEFNGDCLDRRSVDLTRDLPTHPYHHEGSWAVGRYLNSPWAKPVSLAEAIALVERVQEAAERGAQQCLEELATSIGVPIRHIALRSCPLLPPTIEQRIRDTRIASFADSVLYRQSLAKAALTRNWEVLWYDRNQVFTEAATALGIKDIDTHLSVMGRTLGAPWHARHKLAAAAAIIAAKKPVILQL